MKPETLETRTLLRDVMCPYAESVRPRASVREAATRMRAFSLGFLPVVGGQVQGVITDRDIAVRVVAEGRNAERTCVDEVMSRELVFARVDHTVEDAVRLLSANGLRRLPVLEADGRLAGVLGLTDLVRAGFVAQAAAVRKGLGRGSVALAAC